MARYDKFNNKSGGFRAALETTINGANVGVPLGVGLNASGRVVVGAGNTGIVGVLVVDSAKSAADVVDVMTGGEIVDCVGLTAGTKYFAVNATGVLSTVAPAVGVNAVKVGSTVEATRLVVRVQQEQG